jgi:hypothetical protein
MPFLIFVSHEGCILWLNHWANSSAGDGTRGLCVFPYWDTQGVQSFEISVSCLGQIRNVMLAGWMPSVRGESKLFINQPMNGYDRR